MVIPVVDKVEQRHVDEPTRAELDSLIDEMLQICDLGRRGQDFLLDAAALEGGTRNQVPYFLDWLGIPRSALPFENIYIHAEILHKDINMPAMLGTYLERSDRFYLYLNSYLWAAGMDPVYAAIAHELTHLYLVWHGHQSQLTSSKNYDWDNEFRTEVASVVLGLGKVILRGRKAFADKKFKSTEKRVVTQLGYLSEENFVYVYQKVNHLFKVPLRMAAL